jgi:pimeloyl-ACP methyl ester carboxylesterase
MLELRLQHISVKVFKGQRKPNRVVFYFHGFPGPLKVLNPKPHLAPEVSKQTGIEVVAPEYSGLGDSGGAFSFSGTISEAQEVFDHFVRAYDDCEFSFIGYSWGALPALSVWRSIGAERRGRLVLLAPAIVSPGREKIVAIAQDWLHQFGEILQGYSCAQEISDDVEACLINVSPLDVLSESPGQVSIVHGDLDEVIPISASRFIASQVPSTRLTVLTGQGHDFWNRNMLVETIRNELSQ